MMLVAMIFGWVAAACSALSMIAAVGFIFSGQGASRQSSEREAIGWAAVAALMWLVAK